MALTSANTVNNLACMTQTFAINVPGGVSGLYTTSVDLFFRTKSNSFGAELRLVALNNGLPDLSQVIAGSIVAIASANINTSSDGSVATKFSFTQPIFLASGKQYAFVIRALGNSPDYQLWTCLLGDADLATGNYVTSSPVSGSAYFSKGSNSDGTNANWQQIPGETIKYTLYRAKFNIASDGIAWLRKANTEILMLDTLQFASGEPDIRAGDEVYGLTSDLNNANTSIYAKVDAYDYTNNIAYLRHSTGLFAPNTTIMIVRDSAEQANLGNAGLLAYANVNTVMDLPSHSIVPKIGDTSKSLAGVTFYYRGTIKSSNTPVKEVASSDWKNTPNQTETDFSDTARYILSRSNEVTYLSGNSCIDLKADLSSNTDFISPMLDLKEHSLISIENQINSDVSGEDGDYGNAETRYIGKVVTLAEGMDAETIKVWCTAYKPPGTEIFAYVKLWNAEDPDEFDAKPWTLLTQATPASVFSDPKNTEDYRDFEFDLPHTEGVAGTAWSPLVTDPINGDPVQYVTANGTFIDFKKFSVKIVLAVDDDDTAFVYPRLNDVRALALML